MHLFAAQPGGFTDDEGIIDLDQQPARLVILSGADSVLSLLAACSDSLDEEYPSLRLANWLNLRKPAAFDLYSHKVLESQSSEAPQGPEVVVLSLLGGASYWRYGLEQLQQWAEERRGRTLIVVPGEDYADPELLKAGTVDEQTATRIWRYLREGGLENARALFAFLGETFLEHKAMEEIPLPTTLPRSYIYDSVLGATTVEACQHQWQKENRGQLPVVILTLYRSHIQSANTDVFDQLIQQLKASGLNVLPLVVASLKEAGCLKALNRTLVESNAALLLNTTGFAIVSHINSVDSLSPSEQPTLLSRDIPVFQLVLASTTREQWENDNQGLRARDIAMQVSLPELDGRIITRAIAFKQRGQDHPRSQMESVCFELDTERAAFVSSLARKWIQLATARNDEKRIALILANYPSSDAYIGNGVGLDTPESTLNILRWLESSGYTLPSIPQTSTELMETLRRIHAHAQSGGRSPISSGQGNAGAKAAEEETIWLDRDRYVAFFARIPEANQRQLLERWGQPEQDPCFNQQRNAFALSIIRLGNVIVGVQPARGFDIDQQALYHDPDLVPPHSYLAFHAWLRDVFQMDAAIHVGKHGNMEWLPGKSIALSSSCWPEIALGPTPNIYPFIVNDPGEGAQAKRRSQAVIIDHLMPPMTRAELYGDLSTLEELADELYQAMGIDPAREEKLRQLITKKLNESGLAQELGLNTASSEQQMLDELDTYLCDIKEAAIRNGLHTLGSFPQGQDQIETLCSLLRLPRGSQPEEQGLLHALAQDLALPDDYNPLAIPSGQWEGPRPNVLESLVDSPWITQGDTRERLELLAKELVTSSLQSVAKATEQPLLETPQPPMTLPYEELLDNGYHATRPVLSFAHHTLLPALEASVRNEHQALLTALEGHFVAPGPSGAPTRGRLDVLPTGRNFYSVDSRAIPSKTAWSLGQLSADALIERYLQEYGDYPRQLGLSVWGTATMRTGGDDIAQAMALMGIEPVWAPGSQRLVDYRIIPAFQLGRPRVDVTLRVSGLFRDAFPNIIALLDAAVTKLATYEEPGESNTIRLNIENETQRLIASGENAERAKRRASYRIFGAKPGAYGAGVQGLLDSGQWTSQQDLGGAYVQWGGYVYGQDLDGQPQGVADFERFEAQLSSLQVIVQNQDNREHDLLDSADYSAFQGGMAAANKALTGKDSALYFGDHANPSAPRIRSLKEEFNKVLRSRLLNPKWQSAMRKHGYKGAFEMAASVNNLFAFDATSGIVDDHQYALVQHSLLETKENQDFLSAHNPGAHREIAERLYEAIQRGLWNAGKEQKEALESLLLSLDDKAESGTSL